MKFVSNWLFQGIAVLVATSVTARGQSIWHQLRHGNKADSLPPIAIQEFKPGPYCVETQLNRLLDSIAGQNLKATRIQGFRILLYSGNQRTDATKAKENAYRMLPNSNVYTTYQQPTFKVKLGDFYEKREAFLLLGKLEATFPNAVIIEELVSLK